MSGVTLGRSELIVRGFVVLLLLAAFLSLPIGAQRRPMQHPRLANLFLKWHLSEEEARDLARWDVIVLDMEVAVNTPDTFALLRRENPDAKLLAYVTAQEIRRDAAAHPQTPLRRALAARVDDAWYLRSPSGEKVSWWPQTWLLNVADRGWTDTLAGFVAERIASDPRWDGVYYDNLWGSISWFDRAAIDLDRNGQPESAEELDARWQDGVRALLSATRARTRDGFLITGNGDALYAELVNGLLFEHFPSTTAGDWAASMRAYFRVLEHAAEPVIAIINSNTGNTGAQWNLQRVRFGLTSTLLGGGYFSFDFGDLDHAQRWWYDAYELSLGEPQGEASRIADVRNASLSEIGLDRFPPGVYRRDYEHGVVLVNATDVTQRISFDEEFEFAVGSDVPVDGTHQIVSDVELPAWDGAILLRPVERIDGVPFVNGAFARVFRHDGRSARNGFFTYDGAVRGGMLVEHRDLDGDGVLETIAAEGPAIRVTSSGREVRTFFPFGQSFRGELDFATGDLDGNGTWEVVVTGSTRGALLGIFNLLEGRLLTPYAVPFGRTWTRGMTVAMVERPAPGRPSIVVGAGPGSRPEVRVLSWTGRDTGERFLAYDAGFRGGVRVAGGDVDGDGSAEIVTGAGPGGGPHVRVFSGTGGELEGQFFAFDGSRRGGVDVAVADLDGNGIGEIIAMSTYVFTTVSAP